MDLSRRNLMVYGLLTALWVFVVAWQVEEHFRFKNYARTALRNRSKSIASTLGASIRGLQFRGAIFRDRLQPVLNEMVNAPTNDLAGSGEITAVVLLNNTGEQVAFAGNMPDFEQKDLPQEGERWGQRTVTFVYPVEGVAFNQEGATNLSSPVLVLPALTNREPGRGFSRRPPAGEGRPGPGEPGPPPTGEIRTNHEDGASVPTNGASASTPGPRPERGNRDESRPRRPFWARGLNEQEYQALVQQRELHGLVLVMPVATLRAVIRHDLWLRFVIGFFATISVVGSALAWRNLTTSSELQLRLVRASEMNMHLKEMNLAAAGLAHETRNPLNIIRGLAQMISKKPETMPEVREKSTEIIHEADKVAAQLNEFINYSRPREVRRSALAFQSIAGEVVRALDYDLEEKKMSIEIAGQNLAIEADEQLLRQALFNLLLNAVQAGEASGRIEIAAERISPSEARLEVRDNGPGVPPENRAEIFKPYFTTQKQGTGLGLAVVQQIVLAHGWEIECLPNSPRGAIFRITHVKVVG